MPLYLGQLMFTKIKSDSKCDGCNKIISKEEFPITLRYRTKYNDKSANGKRFYSKRFHSDECFIDFKNIQLNKYKETYPLIGGRPKGTGKLVSLTPEQVKRRQTLLDYLANRDRPALEKAYLQKSTKRVHKVLSTIGKRFEELNSFDVEFPMSVTGKRNKLYSCLESYDSKFVDTYIKLPTKENKISYLQNRHDEPNWDNILIERTLPKPVKVVQNKPRPMSHYSEDQDDSEYKE